MILDKLEELNAADNTYVFYTADNGYESKRDFKNTVAQRGFYKAFPSAVTSIRVSEGGIRVPFIVRGSGHSARFAFLIPRRGYGSISYRVKPDQSSG